MALKRLLLSFPLRKQTVIAALMAATILFIVYQFNFVAELSDSSRQRNVGNHEVLQEGKKGSKKGHERPALHLVKREDKLNYGEEEKPVPNHKYDRIVEINVKTNENEKNWGNKKSSSSVKEKSGFQDSGIHIDSSKKFKCVASGKEISVEKVNDDYCDCPEDGSDEPRTNACINGKFSCLKHTKRYPKLIPSGWVNDGVCDCCDGSDEWHMKKSDGGPPIELQRKVGRYLSPCPIICP